MQNNRGYALGLAWVKYNQRLALHHGDMITKAPSFFVSLVDSTIHRCSYYDIRGCNAENVINQRQLQLLKYDYAPQANELALMTNILVYVSMLSNKVLFFNKCFSSTIPRCFSILLIKYIFLN